MYSYKIGDFITEGSKEPIVPTNTYLLKDQLSTFYMPGGGDCTEMIIPNHGNSFSVKNQHGKLANLLLA